MLEQTKKNKWATVTTWGALQCAPPHDLAKHATVREEDERSSVSNQKSRVAKGLTRHQIAVEARAVRERRADRRNDDFVEGITRVAMVINSIDSLEEDSSSS